MSLDMNEALQLQALQAVVRRRQQKRGGASDSVDPEYAIRSVLRWYSKTFFTPLYIVEELPLSDVLQCYWEEHFEGLPEQELEDERARLLEDPDEVRVRQIAEDADDADVWGFSQEVSAQSLESAAAGAKPKDDAIMALKRRDKETELVPRRREPAPEAIEMTFRDIDSDEDSVGFGLLDKPRRA